MIWEEKKWQQCTIKYKPQVKLLTLPEFRFELPQVHFAKPQYNVEVGLNITVKRNTYEKMIPFNCHKSRRTHLQLVTKGSEEVNTILVVKRLA